MDRTKLSAIVGALLIASTAHVATQSGAPRSGEWREYGGDQGYTKYSPLDQINKDNVSRLQIAWRRPAVADEIRAQSPNVVVNNSFRSTPIMVDGVLYSSDGIGLVEAFDPGTGKTMWVQEVDGPEQMRAGGSSRRISYWKNGNDARIFSVRGEYLYALDARSGKLIRSFG